MRRRFTTYYETLPKWVRTTVAIVLGYGLLVFVAVIVPLYQGRPLYEQPRWVQGLEYALIAAFAIFIAVFVILLVRFVVTAYLSDGDELTGWGRLLLAAGIFWVLATALHKSAYMLWSITPPAYQEQKVLTRYASLCETEDGDPDRGSDMRVDWHAGLQLCAGLERRLIALYPRPAWIFGTAPHYDR